MFQVKRNKKILAASIHATALTQLRRKTRISTVNQHMVSATQVMDGATRAVLAVFLSNLLFGLPHSIYQIPYFNHTVFYTAIVFSFFSTHLYVDPIVFVCFNQHHRKRVLQAFKICLSRILRKEGKSVRDSRVVESSPVPLTSQEQVETFLE